MSNVSKQPPEVVERIESASIAQMKDVHIEDVYKQMDWLLESRPTPMDLYYRWEKQNWRTQDLDFSQDIQDWQAMSGPFEGFRTEYQRTFTLFFIGEQAVTDTLSPLVMAAPDEPSRVFLSTQLVDEARHSVFFSRFFEEVVGISGGLSAALDALREETVAGFRSIFENELVEAVDSVRLNPTDYPTWVRGITTYHIVIEGMLALTGMRYLLNLLREMGMLPGFYSGFTAVARDESRHVNFGVRALMEAGVRDRGHLDVVRDQVFGLLEHACRVVAAPDRKFAIRPENSPPNLLINPYEVRDFSLNSLTKRLRVIGLPDEVCEEAERRGVAYYDAAWSEYEDIHGEEHPYRFFQRLETLGAS
jgi:ribonucleoside-diphosphate reductase beta chain